MTVGARDDAQIVHDLHALRRTCLTERLLDAIRNFFFKPFQIEFFTEAAVTEKFFEDRNFFFANPLASIGDGE